MPRTKISPNRRRLCLSEKLVVMCKSQYNCHDCHNLLPPTCEIDHIIPLHDKRWLDLGEREAYVRANEMNNLCALCPNCHAKKTQRERISFYQSLWSDYCSEKKCTKCKRTHSTYFTHKCKAIILEIHR